MTLMTTEQAHPRFLALILPILTMFTHTLLALSSTLTGSDQTHVFCALVYNSLAASASILGFLGTIRLTPRLLHIYIFTHTVTLSFATIGLLNAPFEFHLVNPVIPSWRMDGHDICRDFNAGVGWDDECCKKFGLVKVFVSGLGLILMVAQWWALMNVRRWAWELRLHQAARNADVEKAGIR